MIASDCRRPLSAGVRIQLVHGRQRHACERTAQTTTQTAARPNHTANRFRRRSSPTPYTEQRSYQRISRSNHDGTAPRKHNHPAAKPYRLWHAAAACTPSAAPHHRRQPDHAHAQHAPPQTSRQAPRICRHAVAQPHGSAPRQPKTRPPKHNRSRHHTGTSSTDTRRTPRPP